MDVSEIASPGQELWGSFTIGLCVYRPTTCFCLRPGLYFSKNIHPHNLDAYMYAGIGVICLGIYIYDMICTLCICMCEKSLYICASIQCRKDSKKSSQDWGKRAPGRLPMRTLQPLHPRPLLMVGPGPRLVERFSRFPNTCRLIPYPS